jgi:hypothetical protein
MTSVSACSSVLTATVVAAESDAEDPLDSPTAIGFCALLAIVGLCALVADRLKQRGRSPASRMRVPRSPRTNTAKPQPSVAAPASSVAVPASSIAPSVRARRVPRVIVLYDVTPGQRPFEYNIGDAAGTRGSALAVVR